MYDAEFKGQKVTPETIDELAPKPNKTVMEKFFTNATIPCLKRLAENFTPSQIRQKIAADKKCIQTLKNAGLINKGDGVNYILTKDGSSYLLKISGPRNRLMSLIMAAGDYPEPLPQKKIFTGQYDQASKGIETYQTISRAANALFAEDVIKRKKINNVVVPKTTLAHIPNNSKKMGDSNYVVFQKKVLDYSRFNEKPSIIKEIPDEAIKELFHLIKYVGLWDLNPSNVLVTDENKIVIVDFEQPNNTAPKMFGKANKDRHANNVSAGIDTFGNILLNIAKNKNLPEEVQEDAKRKFNIWKNLAMKDEELKKSTRWNQVKQYFEKNTL